MLLFEYGFKSKLSLDERIQQMSLEDNDNDDEMPQIIDENQGFISFDWVFVYIKLISSLIT